MKSTSLPKQRHIVLSYLKVGRLLYWSLILFVFEAWFYWIQVKSSFYSGSFFFLGFWLWSFLFSFSHIFLVLADGWSRFQNYKRVKDQFFIYGFNKRILYPYMGSKCQRAATEVAAEELGLLDSVNEFYSKQGIRWFHYIPYFMIKDPLFLFKDRFWSRTFLEKNYKSKIDFKPEPPALKLAA